MTQNLEEGDVVLCTVDRIIGTVVFVNIEGNGEGSIITSEIAPGRIRNLRDYVVPKKRIVCKILRITEGRINLSLRRVTQKERKEAMERYKQEKSYESLLRTILKEKVGKTLKKMEEEGGIYSFLEEAKKDSAELEKLAGKDSAKKIIEILKNQKQKKVILKKEFTLTTNESDGLDKIKKLLKKIPEAQIKYISAGKYSIKTEAENRKEADNKLGEIFSGIEKQAKVHSMNFAVKEK